LSAFITGIGWVTAGGTGMAGDNDPFELSSGDLPGLSGRMPFATPSFRRSGRLDRFSRVGITAIGYALRDAGLETWKVKRDMGVIASTVFGCLATDMDYYKTVMVKNGALADPNLFTYTLSNSFLGYASIIFGLTGTNFVLNERTNSGISAISSALDCISLGEDGAMLAGICDVEPPGDLPIPGKAAPGSVFIVMEKALERAVKPYGRISADKSGKVLFNGSEIKDIAGCVKRCLET
jgi:3-oxoacyl-[acyl-carrier-protein] synthase II